MGTGWELKARGVNVCRSQQFQGDGRGLPIDTDSLLIEFEKEGQARVLPFGGDKGDVYTRCRRWTLGTTFTGRVCLLYIYICVDAQSHGSSLFCACVSFAGLTAWQSEVKDPCVDALEMRCQVRLIA